MKCNLAHVEVYFKLSCKCCSHLHCLLCFICSFCVCDHFCLSLFLQFLSFSFVSQSISIFSYQISVVLLPILYVQYCIYSSALFVSYTKYRMEVLNYKHLNWKVSTRILRVLRGTEPSLATKIGTSPREALFRQVFTSRQDIQSRMVPGGFDPGLDQRGWGNLFPEKRPWRSR